MFSEIDILNLSLWQTSVISTGCYFFFTNWDWCSIKCHLTSIGISSVEIRQSYDRLISTMEFSIRRHLDIESGPRNDHRALLWWPIITWNVDCRRYESVMRLGNLGGDLSFPWLVLTSTKIHRIDTCTQVKRPHCIVIMSQNWTDKRLIQAVCANTHPVQSDMFICKTSLQLPRFSHLIHYADGEFVTLQWRHNERDSVSNHQPHYC